MQSACWRPSSSTVSPTPRCRSWTCSRTAATTGASPATSPTTSTTLSIRLPRQPRWEWSCCQNLRKVMSSLSLFNCSSDNDHAILASNVIVLFRCTQASDSSFFVSLETLPATCFSGVDDYLLIDVYVMMFCKDGTVWFCLYLCMWLFCDMKMFSTLTSFSRNLRPAGSKERKVFRTFFSSHWSVLLDSESGC